MTRATRYPAAQSLPELLSLVAVGLNTRGIFALVEARYQRMVLR